MAFRVMQGGNPKSETPNPKQIRNPKTDISNSGLKAHRARPASDLVLRALDLFRIS
jgi:hypothetical protein